MASQRDVFGLSLLSNALYKETEGTAAELAQKLSDALPQHLKDSGLSNWEVTWGPMVFKKSSSKAGGPDLVAYVATNNGTYVAAIAGTNKNSNRDKTLYDVAIKHNVDWNQWIGQVGGITSSPPIQNVANPSNATIARGTALGIYDLATAETSVGPASGQTIVQYLKTLPQGSKLIYTGHSLGGALSPTLALGLANQLTNIASGDTLTLPTAGPTPGNSQFVELYQTAFPANGDFNTNFINTGDPVPCAWNLDQNTYPKRCMQYLFDIFGHVGINHLGLHGALTLLNNRAKLAKSNNKMVYAFLPSKSFDGVLPLTISPPTSIPEYMADFTVTHIKDYNSYFGFELPDSLQDLTIGSMFTNMGAMSAADDEELANTVGEEP